MATPLELFLDLAFVVAIAQAAAGLHHGLVDGHVGDALIGFPAVFFAIWWAWMNFAWFASAYDCDDALYRLAVFVQMTGVLVLAAGHPAGLRRPRLRGDDPRLRDHAPGPGRRSGCGWRCRTRRGRRTALALRPRHHRRPGRLAARLLLPEELVRCRPSSCWSPPSWPCRSGPSAAGRTPWHPHHIVERYGLFTIIVLGESVLAATLGRAGRARRRQHRSRPRRRRRRRPADRVLDVVDLLRPARRSGWWTRPGGSSRSVGAVAFEWGYGHYVVFGSVAAAGAGLAVSIDQVTGHSTLSDAQAGVAATLPVAIYVVTVWILHYRHKPPGPLRTVAPPVTVALLLLASLTPEPVLVAGLRAGRPGRGERRGQPRPTRSGRRPPHLTPAASDATSCLP